MVIILNKHWKKMHEYCNNRKLKNPRDLPLYIYDVSWKKKGQSFSVIITWEGSQYNLGTLKSVKEAVSRRDLALDQIMAGTFDPAEFRKKIGIRRQGHPTSMVKKVEGKFRSRVFYKKKVYHLGLFDTEEEAIAVRTEALRLIKEDLFDPLTFQMQNHVHVHKKRIVPDGQEDLEEDYIT